MSSYESSESDINNDIYFKYNKNVGQLKENLLPNNIKKPIFFNLYKHLIMEKIEKSNEDNSDIQNNENDLETEQKIKEEEQIDEIKFKLFLILYNECDYDDEFKELIQKKQNKDYVKAKRLIIQNYQISNNLISFGKKNYCFIPQFSKSKEITFNYLEHIIKLENNKNIYKMFGKDKTFTEKEFKKMNQKVLNFDEEKDIFKKAKSQKHNKNSNKSDINSNDKKYKSNRDNKSNETQNDKNKALSQITPEENENLSKISETSDNEINGHIFFDKNNRYIFKADYSKEIDGIFSKHTKIKLNKKGELDLLNSLDCLLNLLRNKNENFDINNDIRCHLIYKNFQDEEIPENEPFFLEVKTSMAELTDLLRQIKEISKVVNNTKAKLPKYIIGIICKFDQNQIEFQQKELGKQYKKNGKDTFFEYIMGIIKENKINVLIGAIKDEKIFEYPLGTDDFLIEGERLKKRIDINFMNKKICNGKEVSEDRLKEICIKYPYKSLNYYPVSYDNYMAIHQKYNMLKIEYETIKEEKQEMQEENEKMKQEMQEKYEKMKQEMQEKYEKMRKEYEEEIEKLKKKNKI